MAADGVYRQRGSLAKGALDWCVKTGGREERLWDFGRGGRDFHSEEVLWGSPTLIAGVALAAACSKGSAGGGAAREEERLSLREGCSEADRTVGVFFSALTALAAQEPFSAEPVIKREMPFERTRRRTPEPLQQRQPNSDAAKHRKGGLNVVSTRHEARRRSAGGSAALCKTHLSILCTKSSTITGAFSSAAAAAA